MFVRILWIVGAAVAATSTWGGLAYYLTPIPERPFSALHDLYAPTGLLGQGFGVVGTLMVISGVLLYSARKRFPVLARFGKLRDWLNFHIFLCLLGPFLIVLHTTFKVGGFVAISFWSMALVVGSGVFGRYVYSWIPKTISGHFVGAEEIRKRIHRLVADVERQTGLPSERLHAILGPADAGRAPTVSAPPPPPTPSRTRQHETVPALSAMAGSIDALFRAERRPGLEVTTVGGEPSPRFVTTDEEKPVRRAGPERRRAPRPTGILRALGQSVAYPWKRRRERSRFRRELAAAGVAEPLRSDIVAMLDEERRVEHQLRVLQPFQRAFRYWHAFHLPLAFVMLAALAVHVAVAVALGYTWIFGS